MTLRRIAALLLICWMAPAAWAADFGVEPIRDTLGAENSASVSQILGPGTVTTGAGPWSVPTGYGPETVPTG